MSEASRNRQTYIPPHIERAMSQHMQRSMPAHLKKYAGGNTYVPQHAQQAMNKYMQKAMPTHLKQYSGAYMQQKVIDPGLSRGPRTTTGSFAAPVNNLLRQDHSNVSAPQYQARFASQVMPEGAGQPGSTQYPSGQSPPPAGQTAPAQEEQAKPQLPGAMDYDFIFNPQRPPHKRSLPFSHYSKPIKIGLIAGGLIALFIVFSILRSLFGGGPNLAPYTTIAQDQQTLIQIATDAQLQENLSTSNQNFAATAQLSLTSSQSQIAAYLKENGRKLNKKDLVKKGTAQTQKQLADAGVSETYNQTFKQVVNDKMNTYMSDLKQAYNEVSGKKGRALLSSDYDQAQLMLKQLNGPAT